MSEECNLTLLEFLIEPRVPLSEIGTRARSSPTKIKSLYHLYQLHKNIESGKWTSIYQGKENIAKGADVSTNHFSKFINSPDFQLFGDVQHRNGTTSLYRLNKWVVEAFHFFEKKGMMKNFRTNFNEWKRVFLKRMSVWLLPLLRNGNTLAKILMNKLSTKQSLKGVGSESLKGFAIKSKEFSYEAINGNRNNTEQTPFPEAQEMHDLGGLLRNRFQIRDGDVCMLSKSFSLNHHKRAIILADTWLKRGMEVKSPVRMYQECLNRTKNNYGYRTR